MMGLKRARSEDSAEPAVGGLVGREAEWRQLSGLLGGPRRLPASLLLCGPAQSGKERLVMGVARDLGLTAAVTSCHAGAIHPRLIYRDILGQLDPRWADGPTPPKVDHLVDLVEILKNLGHPASCGLLIVLRHAEKLRELDFNLLPGCLKLQEWTGLNLSVVLLTRVSWNKFNLPSGLARPRPMVLSQYSKEQMTRIISNHLQKEHRERSELLPAFYENYTSYLIGVFYLSNRTLSFLLWIARYHFESYSAPIKESSVEPENTRALIRNIEKALKTFKTELHIREMMSNHQTLSAQSEPVSSSITNQRIHVELPFHSKFLLIAAYLASYNPVQSDKRFFMKHHGMSRKRPTTSRTKEKVSCQLTGPKAFPLDRMMAIFYSIVDDQVRPSANIGSQISSLVSLQFLVQVGLDDALDSPRYKCIAGLDLVAQLSRQVQFEIHRYLYDFV